MNADTATIKSDSYHQRNRVVGGTITALAIVSIVASLVYVTGLDARPITTPSLSTQGQSVLYFPAQFELKPAPKETSVFEY